jgi:hypothetical protein
MNRRAFFKLAGGAAALGAVSQATPLGLWSKIAKWFEPADPNAGWYSYRYTLKTTLRPNASMRLRFVSQENFKPCMVVRPPRREHTPGYRTYIMAKEGILS